MVSIASQSGTTSSSSMPSVITVTAGPRLPPSRASRDFSSGQLATTSMAAQTAAPRNGRKIHSEPAISSRMQMIARVVRVRSWRRVVMAG